MAMRAAGLTGAKAMVMYVVDHQQRQLLPLRGGSAPRRDPIAVDGTVGGRAYALTAPCAAKGDGEGERLWLPLVNGSERIGVLEVVSPSSLDDEAVDQYVSVASLLAELLVTRNLYSDTIEQVRRLAPMRLAAEMLRAQLPPLSFSTGHLMISGVLEPCYDVGGDAFDYAVNGDTAHLALFDAAGHGSAGGMRAVMLASLTLASYRNARRAMMSLIDTYHFIDSAVRTHDRYGMITAVLSEIDQRTGVLRVISAGHPSGMVIRQGRVAKVLPTPTALPVTPGDRRPPVVVEEALEPGDRLLLYTDGIIEARTAQGEQFGTDRLVDFALKAAADQLPAPETARRLVHAILRYQDDRLQDDATILLADWRSPAPPHSDTELITPPADHMLEP
jgi:serine phosphatase RsbU (regulator of sigma subunit)